MVAAVDWLGGVRGCSIAPARPIASTDAADVALWFAGGVTAGRGVGNDMTATGSGSVAAAWLRCARPVIEPR